MEFSSLDLIFCSFSSPSFSVAFPLASLGEQFDSSFSESFSLS